MKLLNENEKSSRKNKIRSYPILVLTVFYVGIFVVMLGYIGIYSYKNRQVLMNNNYNTRQQILTTQNKRGNIYAGDGTVLAYSEEDANGDEVRVYPYGREFAHVLGYATNGRSGLEASENYYLIKCSMDLSEKAEYEQRGEKYPADSLYTTLDIGLQEVAYKALAARKGAVVVTDPKTGQILAMVSKPDYDPGTIKQDWEDLVKDTHGEAKLLNRATQGLYPPGSTFKIVTALAYLKEHEGDYQNYRYTCSGKFKDGEDVISCFHGESHGSLDLYSSFAKSCNSSFANIGVDIDRKVFADTLKELMFNQEQPLDIAYKKSKATISAESTTADVMQLAIGQGTTGVTPMHINMITCAAANDGLLMKPYLVKAVKSLDGKVVLKNEPESYKKLMTAEQSRILREMMEQVVQNGTATNLKGLSYTSAGKTGSAEFNTATSDSHAWFTGYAPADDPRICVTIIVENAGTGGSYAVPIAKRIFDAYFGVE
ncbi:MAG: penicillin-binding protein 2 [Butyrivibrio sp.]|nr:penicillin-binding protein 2 [Butyrivibrio sp.]